MSLWTELRDEAHRTSNQFNGRRLEKSRLQDPFSKLPGIGAVTSKKMRSMFGSMKSFLASDIAVLEDLKWLSRRQKNMLIAYHSANQRD
jgi:excinuclease UvrABC nuclease subunit